MRLAREAARENLGKRLDGEYDEETQLRCVNEVRLPRAGWIQRRLPCELGAVQCDDYHDQRLEEPVLN